MSRPRKLTIIATSVVLAVVTILVVVGFIGRNGSSNGETALAPKPVAPTADQRLAAPASTMTDVAGSEAVDGAVDGAAASNPGASEKGGDYAAAVPPASRNAGQLLVRNGNLSLIVARGKLNVTVDEITRLTAAEGGYVMSSSLGSKPGDASSVEPVPLPVDDGGEKSLSSSGIVDPYASLVVRIPGRRFDAALRRFAGLGTVQSATTSSDDVTSQVVDLRARLRHFRAVERRLVGFLDETDNVTQMLAVQDRLDDVQLQIEQLTAEMKYLRETVSYGTLTIFISEKDRVAAAISGSNTFAGTLRSSLVLLARGARVTALALTAALPFLVVAAVAGLVIWRVTRRLHRVRRAGGQSSLPAS